MTIKLIKTEYFNVDHESATEHFEMLPAPNDRPLKDGRVADLREHIKRGLFHGCEWAIAKCNFDGTTRRVNGKHTSHIFSDKKFKYGQQTVAYTVWECDTLVELAIINSTYDRRVNNRSTSETNKVFAAAVPALDGAMNKTINDCVTAIACVKYGKAYNNKTKPEERAKGLIGENDFCAFVRSLLEAKSINHIVMYRRFCIMAAMYKTFAIDREAAREFWTAVMKASGTNCKKPDRRLQEYIIKTPNRSIKADNDRNRAEIIQNRCLHYWGQWRKTNKVSKMSSAAG